MKPDYLEFSNKGEVPINAFKLLGASSKRGDSTKIGYFGTGLKYALAVLLREGVEFKIYSGAKEVLIGTRKTDFLDQKVTVVTVNGEKTSITIEAGIDWELWFAIREIYSNTLDENGTMKIQPTVTPITGQTKIYILRDEKLKDLTDNWSSYFSNTRQILSDKEGYHILQKNNNTELTVFRKGIRAYKSKKNSIYDYDIDRLKINESRVVVADYEARQRCAEALALCQNREVLEHFAHTNDCIEKDPDFWTYLFDDHLSFGQFSETWFEVFKDKRIVPAENAGFYGVTSSSILLPSKLCEHLYKQFKDRLQIMGATKENYLVVEDGAKFAQPAMARLASVGFDYPLNKVKIVKFKDNDVFGLADNGLILLSEKLKTPAYQPMLLEVLFEEVAHAKSGYSDNTRPFQTYIIRLACALMAAPIPEGKTDG